jgi:hypothetical protein
MSIIVLGPDSDKRWDVLKNDYPCKIYDYNSLESFTLGSALRNASLSHIRDPSDVVLWSRISDFTEKLRDAKEWVEGFSIHGSHVLFQDRIWGIDTSGHGYNMFSRTKKIGETKKDLYSVYTRILTEYNSLTLFTEDDLFREYDNGLLPFQELLENELYYPGNTRGFFLQWYNSRPNLETIFLRQLTDEYKHAHPTKNILAVYPEVCHSLYRQYQNGQIDTMKDPYVDPGHLVFYPHHNDAPHYLYQVEDTPVFHDNKWFPNHYYLVQYLRLWRDDPENAFTDMMREHDAKNERWSFYDVGSVEWEKVLSCSRYRRMIGIYRKGLAYKWEKSGLFRKTLLDTLFLDIRGIRTTGPDLLSVGCSTDEDTGRLLIEMRNGADAGLVAERRLAFELVGDNIAEQDFILGHFRTMLGMTTTLSGYAERPLASDEVERLLYPYTRLEKTEIKKRPEIVRDRFGSCVEDVEIIYDYLYRVVYALYQQNKPLGELRIEFELLRYEEKWKNVVFRDMIDAFLPMKRDEKYDDVIRGVLRLDPYRTRFFYYNM